LFTSSIPWYFTTIEIGAYLLTLLLLVHAWRQGRYMFLTLLMAFSYGYLLEYTDMRDFHAYHYNPFNVMLPGGVPLAVSLSWGVIFYAALQTSNMLGFAWQRRPWLDGLLGLVIDLAMDPIAARLGYWVWTPPGPWLGIPLGNFFGWLAVITILSYVWRATRRRFQPESRGLPAQLLLLAGVMVASLVLLFVVLGLFTKVAITSPLLQAVLTAVWIIVAVLVLAPVVATFKRNNPVAWPVLAVPLFFFGYMLFMLVFAVASPGAALVVNTAATAVAGLALYTLPYQKRGGL